MRHIDAMGDDGLHCGATCLCGSYEMIDVENLIWVITIATQWQYTLIGALHKSFEYGATQSLWTKSLI